MKLKNRFIQPKIEKTLLWLPHSDVPLKPKSVKVIESVMI